MANTFTQLPSSSQAILSKLRLAPTQFENALPIGVTDPYTPASGFGPNCVIGQRVSTFNSEIKCLPAGTAGDIVVLFNAGDGGAVTTQTGMLILRHMVATYDDSNGGSSASFHGFYCPGQRDMYLRPADGVILRRDDGHVSWRVIGSTSSARLTHSAPDILSLVGYYADAALASGTIHNYGNGVSAIQTASRLFLTANAAGSTLDGLVPPTLDKTWDVGKAAYIPYGGEVKIITNAGSGNLTLSRLDAGGTSGWQFLSSANVVIPQYESRTIHYEPQFGAGFWMIHGKP